MRGRAPNHARNAAFLAEWNACQRGLKFRLAVAEKYGIKNANSAAVIAHRLRTYGKTSAWPAIDEVESDRRRVLASISDRAARLEDEARAMRAEARRIRLHGIGPLDTAP